MNSGIPEIVCSVLVLGRHAWSACRICKLLSPACTLSVFCILVHHRQAWSACRTCNVRLTCAHSLFFENNYSLTCCCSQHFSWPDFKTAHARAPSCLANHETISVCCLGQFVVLLTLGQLFGLGKQD